MASEPISKLGFPGSSSHVPEVPVDSSSVSVTAYFTGQVWCENGLAPAEFGTRVGRFAYLLALPFSKIAGRLVGADIDTFLLERHVLLDYLLTRAIEDDGVTQVVEIAAGISPRGVCFRRRYGALRYIEADLPGMANTKRELLQRHDWLSDEHSVEACDILTDSGPQSVEALLGGLAATRKTVIVTEGLVNYFDLETLNVFWSRLARASARFPECRYLTDIYPDLPNHPLHRVTQLGQGVIERFARNDWPLHYGSDDSIADGFRAAEFKEVTVHDPDDYRETLGLSKFRYPSVVRVVEAR